jgi:ectoine hydroxylase-related dioxygenase (phytanoyl-CoA dioxygenase family)
MITDFAAATTNDAPGAMSPALSRDGFEVVRQAVGPQVTARLIAALHADGSPTPADRGGGVDSVREKAGRVYAVRNLMAAVPAVAELATSPALRALVEPVLGGRAFPVRALLFDKTPGANWKVAWHQDLSIAVRTRIDVPGFGPWSVKAGVHHVQPPASVLERMLTVRLHLDDCGPDNGPLLVLPGSHVAGALSPAGVREWRARVAPVACHAPAGGAVLMRPLLLHASSAASAPGHRRVIHVEYANADLPGGLEWAERAPR